MLSLAAGFRLGAVHQNPVHAPEPPGSFLALVLHIFLPHLIHRNITMSNKPESINEEKFSGLDNEMTGEVLGGLSATTLGESHVLSKQDDGHYKCDDHKEDEAEIQ